MMYRVPHPEQIEGWDTTTLSAFDIPTEAKRSRGICFPPAALQMKAWQS